MPTYYRKFRINRFASHHVWTVISSLLIVAILLPSVPISIQAQTCQGEECPAANPDVARYTTYAMVSSQHTEDGQNVLIEWTTAYETFNAGFNILVETEDGLVKINDELIFSEVIESLEPQYYSYIATLYTNEFYLEHVTIEGESHPSGPFVVGEHIGGIPELDEVNWSANRSESMAMAQKRQAVRAAEINAALDVVRGQAPSADEPIHEQSAGVIGDSQLYLPQVPMDTAGVQAAGADEIDAVENSVIELHVKKDGVYRVTHADLLAKNIDLTGVPAAYLALSNNGAPIRIRMMSTTNWGVNSYFDFIGTGLDTLYTDTNVYLLKVDRSKAFRTYKNMRGPDIDEGAPSYYMESIRFEDNTHYHNSSTSGDPWSWTFAYSRPNQPKTTSYTVSGIDSIAAAGGDAHVSVDVWGYNDVQHHIKVLMNSVEVHDEPAFSGASAHSFTFSLSNDKLVSGDNVFSWTLPGDLNVNYDVVGFESFTVEYPRHFVAQHDGQLTFTADSERFEVAGFTDQDVVVYGVYRDRTWHMSDVDTATTAQGNGIIFRGWPGQAEYHLAAESAIPAPDIYPGRPYVDITSGFYDYVIIFHPDFEDGIEPLIVARDDEYAILEVNIRDIYAQFGHAIYDADALHQYIQHAIENMNARYILLVGADSRDYLGFLPDSAPAYIPSLYRKTFNGVNYAPVDPLYTDIDGDWVPDAALGRLSVTDDEQLADVIDKTLNRPYHGGKAVFAADQNDGPSYTNYSNEFAAELFASAPSAWQPLSVVNAYLDINTVDDARDILIDAINGGVDLVSYLGHSNLYLWTFKGLLNTSDVGSLSNAGKPTVVLQWGCYGSLYNDPTRHSISREFLVGKDKGAAAVFGATGLTSVISDVKLADEVFARIGVPGTTIGDAMYDSKKKLAETYTEPDVMIGWVLEGDPTLKLIEAP